MNPHRSGPPPAGESPSADAERQRSAEGDVEASLRAVLPGLRLVDRDLELDGVPLADLVGEVDGRLVLVLLVDGEGDGPVLAALDALTAARRDGELLGAHLGLVGPSRRAPLVLLVAERFGERLRDRLRLLPSDSLWLLERRAVRTARRGAQPLVRLAPATEASAPMPGEGAGRPAESRIDPQAIGRFLAQLPPGPARLGRELIERIARIDPELEHEIRRVSDREQLWWSFRDRPLCGLAVRDGRLEGRLPESPVPHAIQSVEGIDAFLEWVLSCHLELLDAFADREAVGEVELVPPRREPLLTPEELEAFRE